MAGSAIGDGICGLFGGAGVLFPLYTMGVSAYFIFVKRGRVNKLRLLFLILLFWFFCFFGELISEANEEVPFTPAEAFIRGMEMKKGGGFFGGILSFIFQSAFSKPGAFIICIALILILVILIAGRLFLPALADRIYGKEAMKKRRRRAKERSESRRERAEIREEQRDLNREKRIYKEKERLRKEEARLAQRQAQMEEEMEKEALLRRDREVRGVGFHTLGEDTNIEKATAPNAGEVYENIPVSPTPRVVSENPSYDLTPRDVSDIVPMPLPIPEGKEDERMGAIPYAVDAGDIRAESIVLEPTVEEPAGEPFIEETIREEMAREVNEISNEARNEQIEESMEESLEVELAQEVQEIQSESAPEPVAEPVVLEPEPVAVEPESAEEIAPNPVAEEQEAEPEPVIEHEENQIVEPKPWEERVEELEEEPEEEPAVVPVVIPVEDSWEDSEEKSQEVDQTEKEPEGSENDAETEESEDEYIFPPVSLLAPIGIKNREPSGENLNEVGDKLINTLANFGVEATISEISKGPSVTRFEIIPKTGVRVSKILNLSDDIKLNLAAKDIRIEAPIPGKSAVGIEVPNKVVEVVRFRELIESATFTEHPSPIAFCAGKDLSGACVVSDIGKMPHLLIAGATGSGKSVCINTIIMSILYKSTPNDVKLIMIDPKVVELSVYNGIPHLLLPVVSDPKKAAGALNWAVREMNERFNKFAALGVRDMAGYNRKISDPGFEAEGDFKHLPHIVVIVDELADLMMVSSQEVEESICRLAQLARAAGIHLVIATQRPSVNVITGLIKANMPSRIAFAVTSGVDSRTILDMNGAEKLLGKGDMLYFPYGYSKPARVQGAFVSDEEVISVTEFIKEHNQPKDSEIGNALKDELEKEITSIESSQGYSSDDKWDEYFRDAGLFLIGKEKGSIGMLQREFRIGFNRAARIMDQLCEAGVVGPEEGTKPRKVLVDEASFNRIIEEGH